VSSAALRHPPSADDTTAGTLLAVGVHALLVAALTLGVNWRSHEATPLSAELWAAVPRAAAPELAPAPPPPPPEVVQPKVETPPPAPPPKAVEPEAQIVTETKPVAKPVPDEKLAEKQAEDKAREAERRKKDEARKKEEARKQEEAHQRQEQARVERQREENLKRLAAQLPGSAPTPSPGTDTRSAGPSASYAGRVRARIFPNILFTDVVPNRAVAEVQVSVAPDGKITGRRLTKSSGVAAWDEAVLRAVDRTEQLPLDEGRDLPPSILIEFDANKR
jgi:colicin import membrane protein